MRPEYQQRLSRRLANRATNSFGGMGQVWWATARGVGFQGKQGQCRMRWRSRVRHKSTSDRRRWPAQRFPLFARCETGEARRQAVPPQFHPPGNSLPMLASLSGKPYAVSHWRAATTKQPAMKKELDPEDPCSSKRLAHGMRCRRRV